MRVNPRTLDAARRHHGFGKADAKKRAYIYDQDTMGFHLMGGIPLDRDFAHYDLGWSDTKLLQVEIDIPRPNAA